MASKTYPLTWADDEQRARWTEAAEKEGKSLAAFIRDTVEDRLAGRLMPSPEAVADRVREAVADVQSREKKTYEPDWRGGTKP